MAHRVPAAPDFDLIPDFSLDFDAEIAVRRSRWFAHFRTQIPAAFTHVEQLVVVIERCLVGRTASVTCFENRQLNVIYDTEFGNDEARDALAEFVGAVLAVVRAKPTAVLLSGIDLADEDEFLDELGVDIPDDRLQLTYGEVRHL